MSKVREWFLNLFKVIGDVFTPLLPVIATAGVIKGLIDIYSLLNPAYHYNKSFSLLYMIISTVFYYLPVLVAISSAKLFNSNKFIAAVIGLVMLHPDLTSVTDVASGVEPSSLWTWYGFWDIPDVSYHGFIIPVIIVIWMMSRLEHWFMKIAYKSLKNSVVPFFTLFVTSFLALTVVGPLFGLLPEPVFEGARLALKLPYYLGNIIVGILYIPCTLFGADYLLANIGAEMINETGKNILMPIISCCAMAQGGAALAVAFNPENNERKSMLIPASLSAFFGVTAPAVFGINLKRGKPFFAGIIGGVLGSVLAAVLGVYATSHGIYGFSGCFITLDTEVFYIISIFFAAISGFVLSLIMCKPRKEKQQKIKAEVKG